MTINCAIHLGHSHLAALTPALFDRPFSQDAALNEIEHYMFRVSNYNVFGIDDNRFAYGVKSDGSLTLNPVIVEAIKNRIPADRDLIFVAHLGGNAHNALFLLQNSRPIDFILPGQEDLPLLDDAEIVPYSAIHTVMAQQCGLFMDDLEGIRRGTEGRMFCVISPPPIWDDNYVRTVVDRDPYFAAIGHVNVTPAFVRYKAWVVHSNIYREACRRLGVEIVEPPNETVVDGRWLSPDCTGQDPTHANLFYGEQLLLKIERLADARFSGWDWIG